MSETLINREEYFKNPENIKEELNTSFNSELSIASLEVNKEEEITEEIEIIEESKYKIINSYISLLNNLIESNIINEIEENDDDIFKQIKIPEISILNYLLRIIEYSNVEENTLITSLIYIYKISKKIKITYFNIHKILFTSILISLKLNEDEIYPFYYYSQIAGINQEELMQLELNFYSLIDFNLFVNEETFNYYQKIILNNMILLNWNGKTILSNIYKYFSSFFIICDIFLNNRIF